MGVLQGGEKLCEVMDCLDLLPNDIMDKVVLTNWRAKKENTRVLIESLGYPSPVRGQDEGTTQLTWVCGR